MKIIKKYELEKKFSTSLKIISLVTYLDLT